MKFQSTHNPYNCPHDPERVRADVTGGPHYCGGEMWDDTKFTFVCLDCGQEVEPVYENEDSEPIPF